MEPVVQTTLGSLRGSEHDGVLSFKGVPFAEAPVGGLRWRAPEPPVPWSGVREANAFSHSAIQSTRPGVIGELIGIPSQPTSEDCLYLNVWAPAADTGRRPVMVWIHGGGNTAGSGSQPRIDGERLARHGDVVVVTVNYRLGALGFLHLPEIGATGNEALLDQVAALRWVRREIAAFGGDAANVTLFGQSAGGWDIAQLLAMPAAAGTFDKAIPMSGSLYPHVMPEEGRANAQRLLDHFKATGSPERLREVPAEEILAWQLAQPGGLDGGVRWGPVRDGDVIAEDAEARLRAGAQTRGMPLMIGHTRDESALFTVANPEAQAMDEAALVAFARTYFGARAEEGVAVYRAARAARGWRTTPIAIRNAISTDELFRLPGIRTAEAHCAHTPDAWFYVFDYESPAMDGRVQACHSLDIPFVWGTYRGGELGAFCGTGPAVAALSERVMDAYLAFARTGSPATESLPEWPRYDATRRATMHLGLDCHVEDAPMEEERSFWASLG